jgi:hypothetical protein
MERVKYKKEGKEMAEKKRENEDKSEGGVRR